MNEISRIHDQLRRSHRGTAWHGPSVLETLEGVDATLAARKPLSSAHSIWEVALHVAVWESVAVNSLRGIPYPELTPTEDWPPLHGDWDAALARLKAGQLELEEEVLRFPEARLDEKVVGNRPYTYYVLLHGVIQHNLYHAGQIALLKKAPA